MAQLNDTMVQGDLRVTGKIYGTDNAIHLENANLAIPPLGVGDYVGSTGDFFIGSGSGKNLPNTSDNFNIHTTVTHFTGTAYRLSQIATPTSGAQPTGIYERGGISSDGVSWTFSSWMSTGGTGQYLPLSGGTMSGQINAWGGQYNDSYTSYGINMGNSNIVGLNSLYTSDPSDHAGEGIHFKRDDTHTDTLWMAGGHMYFVPNRTLVGTGSSTSAADSKKVAILPASITSGHVVVTDGTSGDVKGVAASSLTVGTAGKLVSTLSNSGTIDPTNIFCVTGSTDGFKMDYSAATDDAGKMTIYTTDDADAAISIGNTVSGTYKEAISVVDGSAKVNGTATTQYHGYAEFSSKTKAYGLLATIDTSGMGGNWDIHAIFSIQHIQDTGTNYPGDQKLVVDIRTNGDATRFSYYATNLTRGINNSAYSIKMYRDSSYTNVRIYAYGGAANTYGSVIIRLESCTNWFGSSLVSRITLNRGAASTTTPTGTSLTVTEQDFLGPTFKGTAYAAYHLGSYGTALEWPYPSSSGKPYALLANKGVATNTNWSFGQLFKLEVANAFVIFKVSVKGNKSAVVEARTDILYFCNMTRAQLEQILVVRYGFTANKATNGAIVAIYADMSKVANLLSVYTRATLRQLDNQSDGQYAYEHWNSFTFFTNEMVASVEGAAPTMNIMYYTKDEIDGALTVINNNINNITSGYKIRIVSTIPSSFDENTIYFI